jgi:hypothetical protein
MPKNLRVQNSQSVVRCRRRVFLSTESLEQRTVLTPGIGLLSATAIAGRAVQVTYSVSNQKGNAPFALAIDRSAQPTLDYTAVPITQITVDASNNNLTPGTHTILVPSSSAIDFDPAHPFVLAVVNPASLAAGGNPTGQVAEFRIYTIGAVTHGLEFFATDALWVNTAAADLKKDGYDVTIPFFWLSTSDLAEPGQTQAAGAQLAAQIESAANSLPSNAIIDLHLIGHSRGTVVISQAMLDIDALEQQNPTPQLLGIKNGFTKMTFLDPHPANNTPTPGNPTFLISPSPGPFGRLANELYQDFQLVAQDPAVVVPPGVQDAEVYYQQASYLTAISPIERLFNLWGEGVIPGATHVANLTGIVNGHFEVHDWYAKFVIPRLSTAAPFFVPPQPSIPALHAPHNPTAYEVSVLFPTEVHNRHTTVTLVNKLTSAEVALNHNQNKVAASRFSSIERLIKKQSKQIDPQLATLVEQQLQSIVSLLTAGSNAFGSQASSPRAPR